MQPYRGGASGEWPPPPLALKFPYPPEALLSGYHFGLATIAATTTLP